jgi:uridine phosphorylase
MIAVTFALRAESSAFVAKLRTAPTADETVVVHTGVGRDRCQARIEEFLKASPPKLLISSGFAGAVSEQLQTGDLIIGREFSDPQLLALAAQVLGHDARVVNLVTTDSIANSAAQRNELARTNADAVDMETEIIANACRSRNIPVLSLRAISDSVAQPLPLPPAVLFDLTKQKTNLIKLGSYLLVHPSAVLRLLRFSRQIQGTRNHLASALFKVIERCNSDP